MRLFLAVDVDRATRQAAEHLRARLRDQRAGVERVLRWVEPQNLHLTLRFLGEREDVAPIERALAPAFGQSRFTMTWTAPAWLPPRGRPRVFYVAVGQGEETLRALAEEVGDRLTMLGIPREDRPFTAHLTLARVRDVAEQGILRQAETVVPREPFAPDARVSVDDIVLYESRLSPHGPTYTARRRFALA